MGGERCMCVCVCVPGRGSLVVLAPTSHSIFKLIGDLSVDLDFYKTESHKVDTQCIKSSPEYIRYTDEATRERHQEEKQCYLMPHTTITQPASERSKDRQQHKQL